ncbi:AIPR family protein [Clostridium aestuarii]|uniref:AIPR family protein n=1 Tax=Clostridium aestuarii TaxID=338193 RepID=A0ABT4D3V4_9CLOT|nr:AIPR family protein [Clostridium aestuarii]MCY6485906.1 AIPR family protein [Clostridium aestuarii]
MTDKEFFKIIRQESDEYSNDLTEGFPYWVMKIFFGLSDDNLFNAIEGLQQNDESIDGFFVNDELQEIIFVQCKSALSEKQIKPCKKEWLSYFYDIPNKLENNEYIDNHRNEKVREIAAEYLTAKNKGYKLKFYFFHLGYLPTENRKIIYSYEDENTSFEYFGLKEIKEQWEEYDSKMDFTTPEAFEIKVNYKPDPNIIDEKIGRYHTIISIITGEQLIKLRENYKYRLFEKNVRFSLGTNKINKSITQTALTNKSNFYFYNNGITVNCKSYKYKENTKIIRVEYPQIINGAQTVEAIYEAYKKTLNKLKRELKDKEKAEERALNEFKSLRVLFRLIQSDKHDSEFAMNVIRYNNSQNAVKIRDFYSNTSEQIKLQKKFAEYGYFYEIKRGERTYIKKETHIMLGKKLSEFKYEDEKLNIEKLCSLYRAYLGEPSAKEVGAKYILNSNEIYASLFGTSANNITNNKVKEMIIAYNIFSIIEEETKNYNKILKIISGINVDNKDFEKLQELIKKSRVFKSVFKNKFNSYEIYEEKKDTLHKKIKRYYPLTQGKYVLLAIFKLILDECEYEDLLIKHELFHNKQFIDEKVVTVWLVECLDKLLIPEFEKTLNRENISLNTFYLRTKTFENIKEAFEQLDIDENREFNEIFELKLN